ncbi:unnamed protein product [Kuraishia capsulata CBS 1993]|uniref:Ribosomal protein n=1 Tax=Kuraishia capsulata CBS 1993 TaxID=1382522 RepID=W6MU04_9ASCO|nr:uncharacterized protein KUCA_T00001324001 [Kuraishia capsulata CBS 1993]CDK25355.1 unnamed protein product [Kuraishia capsulata CBS 1993]
MLTRLLQIQAPANRRFFQTSAPQLAKKMTRADLKKENAKRTQKKRTQARKAPETSPLFLEVPEALRYLRAAEVGRPVNEATITTSTVVVSDKGVTPVAGSVRLPRPLKQTNICALTTIPEQAENAKKTGAQVVGGLEVIKGIKDGSIELTFDNVFATPEMVPHLREIARVLGPKGLMPNAKRGTIVDDLEKKITEASGTTPFRQKSVLVALAVGKCHFSDSEILKNIMATRKAIREAAAKIDSPQPVLIGQTTITSTHGPGIVINF